MSRILGAKGPGRVKKPYDKDNLLKAYEATTTGMSVYRASRVYDVPESTLRDRTRCNVALDGTPGPDRLLTTTEEESLVNHVKYMADIGYGYSKSNIQYLAADYVKSVGKYVQASHSLSNKWFYGFLKRWPDLKLAKPQKLHLARAKGASKEVIDKYFRELKAIMTRHSFNSLPERIFNIDETGVSTEHTPSKVVCGKDSNPQAITSPRSANVTIIAGANALGNYVPPFYVFPGKRWSDDLLTGAPVGSTGKMSQTGWSNSAIFETYVMDHLAKHAGIKEGNAVLPTLILYDGHKSHISLTLTDWARKRNVVLFVLPPHTSHLTQPLDVGVFAPFKNHYYRECQTYLHNNPGVSITRYEVAALSAQPYIKALCPANITNAFRKSGIFPFDRGVIGEAQTAPAIIYPSDVFTANPDTSTTAVNTTSSVVVPLSSAGTGDIIGSVNAPPVTVCESQLSTDTSTLAGDFLETRKIKTVVQKKSRRKFVPPYKSVIGNLMKKANTDILRSNAEKQKSKHFSSSACKKTKVLDSIHNMSSRKGEVVRPSTSGLCVNNGAIPVSSPEISDDSDASSLAEEEKCCACNKFQPQELRRCPQIVFVKWGKCDFCPHWTHLVYCSEIRVLRRHGIFRCPHCLCEE